MEKKRTKNFKVGDVLKGQVDKETGQSRPDYIKLNVQHSKVKEAMLKALNSAGEKGLYLDLKSKSQQLKDFQEGVSSGRLKGDYLGQMEERIQKIPDFVRFEIYLRVERE